MARAEDIEYTCTLSEDTLEVAKKELHEDPSTRLLEIKTLRDRLEQYPGLKSRLDPQFLIRFLRARKFDQERAFELVVNYYRMRKEDPAIFAGLKPSTLTHVYDSDIAYPYPYRDRLGRKVYIIHPARADSSRYTMTDVFKTEFLNLSKLIEDEETQVRGLTVLLDYAGFGMSHCLQVNSDFVRRMARLWTDTFPGRLKSCLLVNEPHFIDIIVVLFAQFAKAKHVRRMQRIGTDWTKLHEYIDPACLPACYGGSLPDDVRDPKRWVEVMAGSEGELGGGRTGTGSWTSP